MKSKDNQMKHLLAAVVLCLAVGGHAQTPFNPDSDGDNLIGSEDLLGLLPLYGNEFFLKLYINPEPAEPVAAEFLSEDYDWTYTGDVPDCGTWPCRTIPEDIDQIHLTQEWYMERLVLPAGDAYRKITFVNAFPTNTATVDITFWVDNTAWTNPYEVTSAIPLPVIQHMGQLFNVSSAESMVVWERIDGAWKSTSY